MRFSSKLFYKYEELMEKIKKEPELKTMELKANLNPEQREYLEVLKDKMKKVLGNKTKQELAKAGDLESLKNYKAVLIQILEFLRTKEMKRGLVEYGNWHILYPQAMFLQEIENKAIEGEEEGFGKEFTIALVEDHLKGNLRVDEEGNVIDLQLPGLGFIKEMILNGLNFKVLMKLQHLTYIYDLNPEDTEKLKSLLPKDCKVTLKESDVD